MVVLRILVIVASNQRVIASRDDTMRICFDFGVSLRQRLNGIKTCFNTYAAIISAVAGSQKKKRHIAD